MLFQEAALLTAIASPEKIPRASSLSHLLREQANSISEPSDAASALVSTFGGSVRLQFTFQSVITDPRSPPEAKITHPSQVIHCS